MVEMLPSDVHFAKELTGSQPCQPGELYHQAGPRLVLRRRSPMVTEPVSLQMLVNRTEVFGERSLLPMLAGLKVGLLPKCLL